MSLTVDAAAVALAAISAEASRYTGGTSGATLSSLEVVTTPGAAADVYRAVQTFPGLRQVDEGAGLFVRGGDIAETRILLNDAIVISPYRNESPTGGVFGVFDPFQLSGIAFSSGGFGARYGDALSGVLALETVGRPVRRSGGLAIGLANLSGNLAVPMPHGFGARATATRSNTQLMFDVNGTTREFTHVPEGRDLSGMAAWQYRPTGQIRVYALDQWNTVGVTLDEPNYRGSFDSEERTSFAVATWSDVLGRVSTHLSLGRAGVARDQDFGAFAQTTDESHHQIRARAAWRLASSLTFTAGGEFEARESGYQGRKALSDYDQRPDAPVITFGSVGTGTRHGALMESDWLIGGRARLTAGVRSDYSSLTGARTVDPRLAGAVTVGLVTITAAGGLYHQVPAPLLFEPTIGQSRLRPMQARHLVAGAQAGGPSAVFARLELYHKSYDELVQRDRDGAVIEGGTGRTYGADVFLKLAGNGWGTRLAYSYVNARRSDPNALMVARSPYDITHTLSLLAERSWQNGFRLSAAYRAAAGRPFTPINSASYDSASAVWIPAHGQPMSDRLPGFHRLDLAASLLHSFWNRSTTVFYVAMNNVLDRNNVYDYRYTTDYSERIPVRSTFKRSVYFGVSTTWQ